MKEIRAKYTFWVLSVFLLIIMIVTSRDAGITCDEVLHYDHSVTVYNYFSSHGVDQSALNTPVSNLKYYGQSYDNLVTIFINWFNIEDAYGFRHLMSSFAGWVVILLTALFALWLAGCRAGILVLILFAISPTFIGHTQNNLKDIPFALGYIASIFYTFKFIVSGKQVSYKVILMLTASIAFSISIRAGGLLLICYLYLFLFLTFLFKYLKNKEIDIAEIGKKFLLATCISLIAWLAGILLWPFALQSPFKNVIESYHIMAHFPDSFRQLFEGNVEWSDNMPWYYLLKSMAITIPFIVLTGFFLFICFSPKTVKSGKACLYGLLIFTIFFPLVFVIFENSNLYSSWRQFLFLYPVIVLLSAVGFSYLFDYLKSRYLKWGVILIFVLLSVHPLKFMIKNHPYYYLYYNQMVGGLHGAYGNYETDYYYVSQTKASEWLINYLKDKNIKGKIKVKATYSVQWQFRNHPEIETSYFRNEERSLSDWDYAIVVNRYISPFKLKNKIWPPENAIHVIYADQVPVCAVLERKSKDDYYGYTALNEGRRSDAINLYEKVIKVDDKDEFIFYIFATALFDDGQYQKADSILKEGLKINPDFEPILMYLGNIAKSQNRPDEAIMYYQRLIAANMKYFEGYLALSELLAERDVLKARDLLRTCLTMNPNYKPALIALANTYRKSDPDIADKYDKLVKGIN